jgi:hypothetical protein
MEKKPKLKLDDIKVESFVTSLDESKSNKIKGMGCETGSQPPTQVTCVTCNTQCGTCPGGSYNVCWAC